MKKLMGNSLNPMQLALVYRQVVEATKGTEVAKDREKIKQIIKEEYKRLYPHSYMPIDDKEETLTSIYNNYGRIEECANSFGIETIDELLSIIERGVKTPKPRKKERRS